MKRRLFAPALVALAVAACGGGGSSTPTPDTPTPSAQVTPSPEPTPLGTNEFGVRYCTFVPGQSQPTTMPGEVLHPPLATSIPTATLPAQTSVSADVTQAQLRTFAAIRDTVSQTYVYPDFNGHDWDAIAAGYEALVAGGFTDDDFYMAMNRMIAELGDNHSYYQSPSQVVAEDQANQQGQNFVGIGVLANPIGGGSTGAIISIFPGGPAAEAGLLPHDHLLEVDGQPYRDENGKARSLGPEGTTFELTYQRPGEDEQKITMTRRAVSGSIPIDYCMVPGTSIGYILIPTFFDRNIDEQVRTALEKLTAGGPLDGLVIDNRMNDGGSNGPLESTLGFFTSGNQGTFASSGGDRRLNITGEDIGGSQTVPLVVLAGPETVSFGEVFTGVLQASGRAQVVGSPTAGNVETLDRTAYDDGSRLWLASEAFAPVGGEPGEWEGTGVQPDVSVPTRWDLFTEATDPALAAAIDLLD